VEEKVSLFVTKLLPGYGWSEEEHIKGVELYASVINGVTVAWWEDEARPSVRAVSTDKARPGFGLRLAVTPRRRVSWLRPSAPSGGELQVTVGDGAGVRIDS